MLYYLPDNWVIGPNPTYPNFTLSNTDKEWLMIQYPLDRENMPVIEVSFTDMDAPRWKEAWVAKVVEEELSPYVGVIFEFKFTDGT
jgi:hypothetical protein